MNKNHHCNATKKLSLQSDEKKSMFHYDKQKPCHYVSGYHCLKVMNKMMPQCNVQN